MFQSVNKPLSTEVPINGTPIDQKWTLVFTIPWHERKPLNRFPGEHTYTFQIIPSDDASENTGRLTQSLLLLTLNKARGKDCEDFCVIHPSGSTSLSVTNTRRTARRHLALSDIWHGPKGQICHLMLSHNRKPSHVHLPCQKLIKWIFPWVMLASSTGIDSGADSWRFSGMLFFSPAIVHVTVWPAGITAVGYRWMVRSFTGPAGRLVKGTLKWPK